MIPKIPALVLALAGKVNMKPIAWKIDTTSVTIVFEEGPKMVFNREEVLEVVKPVIQSMEETSSFIKAADSRPLPAKRKKRS